MPLELFIIICLLILPCVESQACDTMSDSSQCSQNQICRNSICQTALTCQGGVDCVIISGYACVSDYCQPPQCTFTGQCVHEQVCSRQGSCVYPIKMMVEEGKQISLYITAPPPNGKYTELRWYKGSLSRTVAFYHHEISERTRYFDGYCSTDTAPCFTSDKVILDITTGRLTFYNVNVTDDDNYYYKFYGENARDTGYKYEIQLFVYILPKLSDLRLLVEDIKAGESAHLECRINRIKPEAPAMYWKINGQTVREPIEINGNNDGSLQQRITMRSTFSKEDNGKHIECSLDPIFGDAIVVRKTIDVKYAPSGRPVVKPGQLGRYEFQQVALVCDTGSMDVGNPPCGTFTWKKLDEDGENVIIGSNVLEFTMEEADRGNYSCRCENEYGSSGTSDAAELIFLPGTPPTETSLPENIFIIAGAAAGGLVLVIVVIVVVVIAVKKRYVCVKKVPEKESAISRTDSVFFMSVDPTQAVVLDRPISLQQSELKAKDNKAYDDEGYLQPEVTYNQYEQMDSQTGEKDKDGYCNEQGFITQLRQHFDNLKKERESQASSLSMKPEIQTLPYDRSQEYYNTTVIERNNRDFTT